MLPADSLRSIGLGAVLIVETVGLLYFAVIVDPAYLRALRSIDLITLLVALCSLLMLPLAVVLGLLVRHLEAAIVLPVLPYWLLIGTYLAVFASSWYLTLEGLSLQAMSILLSTLLFGMLGALG